jgi:hypothetical protein
VAWRSAALLTAALCVPGTAPAGAQAEPAKTAAAAPSVKLTPSPGELTTRSGDHLSAQFVALDCRGLTIRFAGQTIIIGLDKIASASSRRALKVSPGTANDQVTGTVSIDSGSVSVTTRDLGTVRLPAGAFKCHDHSETQFAERGISERDSRPGADKRNSERLGEPPSPELTNGEMARVVGTGPTSSQLAQTTAAPDSSATTPTAAQSKKKPAAQSDKPAAQSDKPAAQSDKSAPGASPLPATPKEQQEETERNSLEFLRNEAVLVQPQKVEGDFGLAYLHSSQQLGNVRVLSQISTLRFGILEGLEGFASLPLTWGQRQLNNISTVTTTEVSGIGDVRFGLKYNAINEGPDRPAVVTGFTVSAPTGKAPYFDPSKGASIAQQSDIRDPTVPQIGTGHWIVTASLTALKSYDPLILFGSINYSKWLPQKFFGTLVDPGDVWEVNSGIGFSVNDTDTLSGQLFIDYADRWKFSGNPITQTGITPINLKIGYTHILSPSDIINPSVIFGLTRDANDAVVMLDWIHRF